MPTLDSIAYELQEERAYMLGRAGRRLEAALSTLAALAPEAPAAQREALLDDAATAAWNYVIVRESVGFHDQDAALAIFGVPPRVLARIGVYRR